MASPNLDNNAGNPAKVSTQGGNVEQHDLAEQIEYDQYSKANKAAAANPRRGFMLSGSRLGGPIGYTDSGNAEL